MAMAEQSEVQIVGPGAESTAVQEAVLRAAAELDVPVRIARASNDRGPGGFTDWADALAVFLAAPAGVVFTKFLEMAAEDAHKQLKKWIEGLFDRLRRAAGTDQVALQVRNLTLYYEEDGLPEEAYRQLLDILRENPGLEAGLIWDVPRDDEGRPYGGVPARWTFR
jgi:hypothetical protein